jgi:NAD(P)-dependent dehydrogenase (short-subunit alcohol dehydrogenase family)
MNESESPARRVVIVTGGAQGIGRAFARRFVKDGYRVVIADTNHAKALEAVAELEAAGGQASAVATDVSDDASCKAMAKHALDHFGRIDVLINNAALKSLGQKNLWDIEIEDWDRLMAVNAKGVWLGMRAVLPAMQAQGGGSIINMASSMVLAGVAKSLHYSASKGAVIAITRSAARELGEFNIRVNCILAGYIPTESWQNPDDPVEIEARRKARIIKRPQVPEDLVGAALFLASPEAAYFTGQSMNLDGGRTHL